MRAYGVKRQDRGCCPGHDKFPRESYATRTSKRAQTRDTQTAHQAARARARAELRAMLDADSDEVGS